MDHLRLGFELQKSWEITTPTEVKGSLICFKQYVNAKDFEKPSPGPLKFCEQSVDPLTLISLCFVSVKNDDNTSTK